MANRIHWVYRLHYKRRKK